jgi:hypothetical protein
MSDAHKRILRQVAHQRQRDLDDYDAVDHIGDTESTGRRHDLVRTATRAVSSKATETSFTNRTGRNLRGSR